MCKQMKLIGPFSQILTMDNLPYKGPIQDASMHLIRNAGVIIEDGCITDIGDFDVLSTNKKITVEEIPGPSVLLPGFVDAHTHICFAGSRAADYAKKIQGKTYQEILAEGGGIHYTVEQTRKANLETLKQGTEKRILRHFSSGVTTMEIKSGYGLSVVDELKMLELISMLNEEIAVDLVPTCLAAHVRPKEFDHNTDYLDFILADILPEVIRKNLSGRVDIFVEDNAFKPEEAERFLMQAKHMGFSLTVHADQFTTGGAIVAAKTGAVSADHLESSKDRDIKALVDNDVAAAVLPGASLGLAMPFAPARRILDAGAGLVIASDWNPGSAPMGDLLTQAALLSNFEKLSFAETMAGMTCRAAKVLGMEDRGILSSGKLADMIAFPTDDYREILYHQGMMKPEMVWKRGVIYNN